MIDTIQVGDAKELCKAIPDGSVDIVFTDPVYEHNDDYAWLGEQAQRVLREGGKAIVWCSTHKQFTCKTILDRYLSFVVPFYYVVMAKMGKLYHYHLHTWTTPMLVYYKGGWEYPNKWVPDTYVSSARPTGSYKWNKNLGVIEYYLNALAPKGSLVWDPFCGYGSVPRVCIRNGFHFIASEIDKEVAHVAINLVSQEQRYII